MERSTKTFDDAPEGQQSVRGGGVDGRTRRGCEAETINDDDAHALLPLWRVVEGFCRSGFSDSFCSGSTMHL